MTNIREEHAPRTKWRSWQVVAVTTLFALVASVGFTAAADSFNFRVRGGNGNSAMLNCAGGMDRLGHPFDQGFTTVFPGDPEVLVSIEATVANDFFLLEKVTTGTHGGTHLDVPAHFIEGARSVDQLDATEFVWPAVVIDVRDRVAVEGGDFLLGEADILAFEQANNKIKPGSMVIIYTGHDELFGSLSYAGSGDGNDGSDGNPVVPDSTPAVPHPGFSGDAVTWMIENRSIAGLGSDGLGPDATLDFNFNATYNILAADGVALPGLNNLDTMNAWGDIIIASAVPLVNGSGFVTDPLACHGNGNGPGGSDGDEGEGDDD